MFIVLISTLVLLMSEIDFLIHFKKSVRKSYFLVMLSTHERNFSKIRKRFVYPIGVRNLIVYNFLIVFVFLLFCLSTVLTFDNNMYYTGISISASLNIIRTIISGWNIKNFYEVVCFTETVFNIVFTSLLLYFEFLIFMF